jgi:hypothetical protein
MTRRQAFVRLLGERRDRHYHIPVRIVIRHPPFRAGVFSNKDAHRPARRNIQKLPDMTSIEVNGSLRTGVADRIIT